MISSKPISNASVPIISTIESPLKNGISKVLLCVPLSNSKYSVSKPSITTKKISSPMSNFASKRSRGIVNSSMPSSVESIPTTNSRKSVSKSMYKTDPPTTS